jgi:rhamnosyltransferase
MFSDQDTYFKKNYISEVFKIYKKFSPKKVFALCPNLFDRNKKKLSGFTLRKGFFKKNINYEIKNFSESVPKAIKITEAMSSGMIMNVEILKKVGYYREDFFLDWIDFEICWRALKKNYHILGLPKVIGSHFLGKNNIKVFGTLYHMHEVFRIYYIIRNGIYIAFHYKMSVLWKLNVLLNTLRYSLGYIIFMRPKILVIKYILLGFYLGISKKLGRISS